MAGDPRNVLDFSNIDADFVTYIIDNSTITYDATKLDGSAQVGLAVTFSAGKTVALCADGDSVVGKLRSVESDLKARVQFDGFCTLAAGNGATVTAGKRQCGALGAASAKGYIRDCSSSGEALLNPVTAIDATTATAVVVNFN